MAWSSAVKSEWDSVYMDQPERTLKADGWEKENQQLVETGVFLVARLNVARLGSVGIDAGVTKWSRYQRL